MFYQLSFRIEKLFRQIRHFYFDFALFIFKFIANQFSFFPGWENIVIITWNNDLIDRLGMSLDLIYLFGGIKRISAISDGTCTLLFISGVEKYFPAVQKGNFRYIAVSIYFGWSRNMVFWKLISKWLSFFVFFSFRSNFNLINTFVFIIHIVGKYSTCIYCSLIDKALLLIFSNENRGNCFNR